MLDGRVSDHQRILDRIKRIRERLPATIQSPQLMSFMERRFKERFDKGVDPEGKRWAPLKPATVRIKQKLGFVADASRPLLRSRTLRDSIRAIRTNASFQSATGLGFRVGVTDAEAAEYGRLHDQGKAKRTVQRKFMGVSDRDAKALADLLRREVRKVVKETL